jgi:hypothetical protein
MVLWDLQVIMGDFIGGFCFWIYNIRFTFRTLFAEADAISDMNFLLAKRIRVWYPKLDECGYQPNQFE